MATKAAKTAKADESKTTLNSIQDNVSERATAVREQLKDGYGTARNTAGAAVDFGKAYYSGMNALGRTLWGFGQEFYGEATEHVQRTMRAKCLTEAAGLQAAYLQNRIETSAAHGKEFIDVAREQAELAAKPVVELLDGKRAA